MTYKLGSLFDGSGGFPLAGSLCGIEPVWASEVEPYPIAVTRSRFPKMKHLGDISKINGGNIEPVDIITFGSPCQDLSVVGKRAGLKHEAHGDEETTRSGLFMEAVRIIKEMREATNGTSPTFALWENVPGAFSSNKGEDFRIVLEELIKIVEPGAVMPTVPKNGWPYADSYCGDGWSIAYRVFDAQYWGVPQRRRRIHLVADFRGERAREVLFEREGVRGNFATFRTAGEEAAGNAVHCAETADREGEERLYCGGNHEDSGYGGGTSADVCGGHDPRPNDVVPYTLKIRSGCEGGGKGALIQTDKSATLSTLNDQYLFQPAAAGFKAGQGPKARGIGWEMEKSPTLASEAGGNSVPCVCVKTWDARGNGDGETVSTLTGDHENRITDYSSVVVEPVVFDGANVTSPVNASNPQPGGPCHTLSTDSRNYVVAPDPVYCLQGNGIDRADTAGCNGAGWREGASYTLNTVDRPAVAFATDVGFFNTQKNVSPTLLARQYKDPHLVTFPDGAIRYIVRRLTPTECARLQGFADRWGDIEEKTTFTPEEYEFWHEVRNTHAAINGKKVQEYTEAQMLTWYNKLHTDSAEYKMWGNGIALPPALYVLQGIVEAMNDEVSPTEAVEEFVVGEPAIEAPTGTKRAVVTRSVSAAERSVYEQLRRHKHCLDKQQYRTLKGLTRSGDLIGAMNGLITIIGRGR